MIPHALAAFDREDTGSQLTAARKVLAWIEKSAKHEFTRRELDQVLRNHFPRATDLEAPLSLLQSYDWIRELSPSSRPGRPSETYAVNLRVARA